MVVQGLHNSYVTPPPFRCAQQNLHKRSVGHLPTCFTFPEPPDGLSCVVSPEKEVSLGRTTSLLLQDTCEVLSRCLDSPNFLSLL